MAIRDCGYTPSECFSRFCPYYLTGKTQQSPAFLWSRPPRLQWAPSRDRKLGQQWPPVCQGAQRFTAGVFLSFFMTCILKLVLYICLLCVWAHACMHACTRLYSTTHTWRSETTCRVPSLPTMGFQNGTQISDFAGKHPYLQNYFISPTIYFETAFLTEPELINLIRPSCPVNSRDPVSASSSHWN